MCDLKQESYKIQNIIWTRSSIEYMLILILITVFRDKFLISSANPRHMGIV